MNISFTEAENGYFENGINAFTLDLFFKSIHNIIERYSQLIMVFLGYSLVSYLTLGSFNLFYDGRFLGIILAENILTVESML